MNEEAVEVEAQELSNSKDIFQEKGRAQSFGAWLPDQQGQQGH